MNDKMNNTEKQALVDWNSVSLGKLTLSSDYGTSKKTNDNTGIPVLRMGNMKDGKIVLDNLVFLELENSEFQRLKLYPGDILINRTNSADLVGKVSIFDLDGDYVCASYIVRFKINQEIINPYYLNYYMNMSDSQNRIKTIATQAIQQANINPTTLKKSFIVKFPKSKHEQDKIVKIISTWDKAIELKEKLIDEKKKQKAGLMQKLYTGKVRIPGFSGKVQFERLNKYIKESKEKNRNNQEKRVLSVTNKLGFVLQEDQFDRIVASKDLSNYKIVRKGQFAYNPSRVNVGSIDLLTTFESGLLSPMYVVFQCKQDLVTEYLYHFIKSDAFLKAIPNFLQGSVRDSLSIDSLGLVKIFIPSVEEQNAIAQRLNLADKEILLLEKELECLKQQKKGLMQLLLTGIVRVNTQES